MNRVWTKNLWDNVITPLVTKANGVNTISDNARTVCLSSPGLDIDVDANDFEINTPFAYMIDGVIYNAAASTGNNPTAGTVFGNPAAHAWIVLHINAAGTLVATQGTATVVATPATLPTIPASVCPIGLIKVTTASTATFTLGTTDFDASNVTSVFYNLVGVDLSSFSDVLASTADLSVATMRKGMGGT
jgi:hypothetical protein